MARNKAADERVKSLVAELLAEENAEGELRTIDDIENAMVRFGDMVACEFGVQALAAKTKQPAADPQCPESPQCPQCGHAGERMGEQTRDVITRRGKVSLTEAKYRCPKCRRLFFPSDSRVGT